MKEIREQTPGPKPPKPKTPRPMPLPGKPNSPL